MLGYFTRPAAPSFHPEFGYVCPNPQFRRFFCVAVVSLAFGAVGGALVVAALTKPTEPNVFAVSASADAAPDRQPMGGTAGAGAPAAAHPLSGSTRTSALNVKPQAGVTLLSTPDEAKAPRKKRKKAAQIRQQKRSRLAVEATDRNSNAGARYGLREEPRRDRSLD